MGKVLLWVAAFSVATAASVTMLGNRDLISGDIYSLGGIRQLLLNWRFITSMLMALLARALFIQTNRAVMEVSHMHDTATNVTVLLTTALSLCTVLISNYLFLGERLSMTQFVGVILLVLGSLLVSK